MYDGAFFVGSDKVGGGRVQDRDKLNFADFSLQARIQPCLILNGDDATKELVEFSKMTGTPIFVQMAWWSVLLAA